jgi:hypothetical protein
MEAIIDFQIQLSACEDCKKFATSSTLEKWNFQKPCVRYRTHADWKPEHVKVVFIAEAPPGTSDGYFYEPKPIEGYAEILRSHLLDLLGINHDAIEQSLKEFKNDGYFLTDAIKCRCDKGNRSHPPRALARNCGGKWLQGELGILGPDKVCILGKTAKEALEVVPDYAELRTKTVGKNCGEIVNARKPVLVWVFPSARASQYSEDKKERFLDFVK